MQCLATDEPAVGAAAEALLQDLFSNAQRILGTGPLKVSALPMAAVLCHLSCSSCYRREWLYKAGGCAGLRFLISHMELSWVLSRLLQMSKVKLGIEDY